MSIENATQTALPNDGELGYGVSAESAKLLQFVAAPSTEHNPHPKVVPLDLIEAYLRSYLSFPNDQPFLPLALFAVLEHCWDECFDEVPYLLISAATQGSGKTRVLELLLFLAGAEKAILLDGDITRAALYTEIETMARVILIDEAEKLQSTASPFRPILNSGYRRGATVLRKIGGENVEFSIFCPKAMAQIGDVYSSLRDRCITIEMRRMQEGGQRKEFVHQVAKEEGRAVVKELEDTLPEYLDDIRNAYLNYHELYPKSLDFLQQGRDKEIWKPLFAICQVIAPERIPELSKSAIDIATFKTRPIRRLGDLRGEEEKMRRLEYTERLVRDALTVVGARDRIASADLVRGLRDIPTSPWRSYEGSGITEISLASMLGLFGIEPKTIRFKPKGQSHSTAKGYYRKDLEVGAAAAQIQIDVELSRNPVTLCSPNFPAKTAPTKPTPDNRPSEVASVGVETEPTTQASSRDVSPSESPAPESQAEPTSSAPVLSYEERDRKSLRNVVKRLHSISIAVQQVASKKAKWSQYPEYGEVVSRGVKIAESVRLMRPT